MTAAEALIQTALLGEAVDGGPALVFVADEDMRYIAVNEFACRTLGYTRDELLELRVSKVAREAAAPAQYDELLRRVRLSGDEDLRRGPAPLLRLGRLPRRLLRARFIMRFVDGVRWSSRGKDAGSAHSRSYGRDRGRGPAASSAARRHKAHCETGS